MPNRQKGIKLEWTERRRDQLPNPTPQGPPRPNSGTRGAGRNPTTTQGPTTVGDRNQRSKATRRDATQKRRGGGLSECASEI